MISVDDLACFRIDRGASRSDTMTSARRTASSPASVIRPGSPGPPPTKITDPICGSSGSCAVSAGITHGAPACLASPTSVESSFASPVAGTIRLALARSPDSTARSTRISWPRPARSVMLATGAAPTTVTLAEASSRLRMGASAGAPAPQTSTERPLSSRSARKLTPPPELDQVRRSHSCRAAVEGQQRLGERSTDRWNSNGDPDPVGSQAGEGVTAADGKTGLTQRPPYPTGWVLPSHGAGVDQGERRGGDSGHREIQPGQQIEQDGAVVRDVDGGLGRHRSGLERQAGGDDGECRGAHRPRR